jgi:rRNA-processing protein FCF1
MEIIVDTNFILTCAKQKIDFFSELDKLFGIYSIIIPKQVLDELDALKNKKTLKSVERDAAELAIDLLNLRKSKIIDLKTSNVDVGIVKYLNSNQNETIVLATLDKGLIGKIKNKNVKILTIRDKKRVVLA